MNLASCALSIIPVRQEPSHRSEMVTQVLFAEEMEILEEGKDFSHVRLLDVAYEGWIQKSQLKAVHAKREASPYVVDLDGAVAVCGTKRIQLLPGTRIQGQTFTLAEDTWQIEGNLRLPVSTDFDVEMQKIQNKYLDSPYLWGGRSAWGIDCSGFSQLVYNHFGIRLKRDAWQQAEEGTAVNFVPEIRKGDLAFFDNEQGRITHVGVMLDAETILHAAGRVRIDKMDSEGIFNAEANAYSHKLRIVKRYLST